MTKGEQLLNSTQQETLTVIYQTAEDGLADTWQNLFDGGFIFHIDEKGTRIKQPCELILHDGGTWQIRAVIPPENQFYVNL